MYIEKLNYAVVHLWKTFKVFNCQNIFVIENTKYIVHIRYTVNLFYENLLVIYKLFLTFHKLKIGIPLLCKYIVIFFFLRKLVCDVNVRTVMDYLCIQNGIILCTCTENLFLSLFYQMLVLNVIHSPIKGHSIDLDIFLQIWQIGRVYTLHTEHSGFRVKWILSILLEIHLDLLL